MEPPDETWVTQSQQVPAGEMVYRPPPTEVKVKAWVVAAVN
jgi:hypothetical protein